MALSVTFPDGSQRRVPGQLIPADTLRHAPQFLQIPINCDPMWRFVRRGEGWYAVPRHAPEVAFLTPRSQSWWDAIAPMADDVPDPPASAAA